MISSEESRARTDTQKTEFKRMGNNQDAIKVSDPILRWIVGIGATVGSSIALWFAQQVQKNSVSVSVLDHRVSAIEIQIPSQLRDLKYDFKADMIEIKEMIRRIEKK